MPDGSSQPVMLASGCITPASARLIPTIAPHEQRRKMLPRHFIIRNRYRPDAIPMSAASSPSFWLGCRPSPCVPAIRNQRQYRPLHARRLASGSSNSNFQKTAFPDLIRLLGYLVGTPLVGEATGRRSSRPNPTGLRQATAHTN
jgi:hypothetical protein